MVAVLLSLVGSLLVSTPASSSAALSAEETTVTKRATSTLTPSDPMPGEFVQWTAATSVKNATVDLQVAKGAKWKTLDDVRTDAAGTATAYVRGGEVGTVTKYRLALDGRTLIRRKVTTVEQTAVLSAPVDIGGNQMKVTATFTPIRKGRRVGLMWYTDGWALNQGETQNATGQAHFKITRGGGGPGSTYRVDAFPRNGAATISSNSQVVPPGGM